MATAQTIRFRNLVAVLWVVGSIAAYFYSGTKSIPAAVAIPVGAAFLVELSFYFSMGRAWWAHPGMLAGSALVSYLIYSIPTGVFAWKGLLLITGLVALAVVWLPLLPRWLDFGFLAFMGGVYLFKAITQPYVEPLETRIGVAALAQLMWFRVGIASVLANRRDDRIGFGFVPGLREWKSGLRHFLLLAPVAAAVIYAIGFAEIRVAPGYWWKAPATFFGILWVVALGEETFFRGILLQRLRDRFAAPVAIAVSSVAFGAVHLWFGNAFPNWKHALVATVLGVFCARAYLEGPGIRAAMVTHALAATVWKTFLR
ncbi:MAG: CPBP family intramembrane glutamic endopeptidase [Bryobacteraceae bacterium]